MTKDGKGIWAITPAGHTALAQFPEPTGFQKESSRLCDMV